MANVNSVLATFQSIAKQRQALESTKHRLADQERRLVKDIGQALSDVGYRLVPLDGPRDAPKNGSGRAVARKPLLPKTLKCPKCERRFSRPPHVARHMSAMHRRGAKQRGAQTATAA